MQNVFTVNLSVHALEKLFENEPEAIIQIRKAAIVEFARKKITGVLDESLRKEIQELVNKEVGTLSWNNTTINPKLLDKIKSTAQSEIEVQKQKLDTQWREKVIAEMQNYTETLDERIKNRVEIQLNKEIETRIASEVKRRLDNAFNAAKA